MIIEGIMTTINVDGGPNMAPVGAGVSDDMERLTFRLYKTTTTCGNLLRTGQGVFHVTDDVLLVARSAVGTPDPLPDLAPAEAVKGNILSGACRWYAVRTASVEDAGDRAIVRANIVDRGRLRDFVGFNRAKHAVVEAAILATRIDLLGAEEVLADLDRLRTPVEKTGGGEERAAFGFLLDYVTRRVRKPN